MGYSCEDIQLAINVLPSDTLFECLKERVANLGEKSVSLFSKCCQAIKIGSAGKLHTTKSALFGEFVHLHRGR